MNNFFHLKDKNTTVKKEIFAGITTFLTMYYIVLVNPAILSATGMDKGALITVTALSAFIGTIIVALWANVPFAMAPGMGLNAYFTYTLVLGQKLNWQTALGVVFLSGVFFLILTLVGIRQKIVNAIPKSLRIAISSGIGLFITFIGFKNLGLIVDSPATLVTVGKLTTTVTLGLIGVIIISVLEIKKVKGSILIGIIFTTILGILFGKVQMPDSIISMPNSIAPIAFKLDILSALKFSLIGAIFSFMFVDLFDSIGTILACSYEANLVQKDGTVKDIGKMLSADAIATISGALLGTSTTTTYIESSSGIADGGRTGLTSVVTALLFLVSLIFTPLLSIVPSFATAPALIIVGVFMFKNIKLIDFSDFSESIPAFLTIILMPLTYSISTGIVFGFLSYILINGLSGKIKKITVTMWIVGIFSAIDLIINMR